MAQARTATSSSKRSAPRTLAGIVPPAAALATDSGRSEALASYEAALALMQQGKYDKAHQAFDRMLLSSPGPMAERIRMYISACLAQATKAEASFGSPEERSDYAVSLLNEGAYEDARAHFHAILAENAGADYAFYGLAVLASMTGDASGCLEHLREAIRHNPRNRIQARSDSDFQDMADDPRFTDLLYPEV